MELGIQTEALEFAAPIMMGFVGGMVGLLTLFTAIRWNKSQEAIRNLWTRTFVAIPLLILIFSMLEFGIITWSILVGFFAIAAHREYCIGIDFQDKWMQRVGSLTLIGLIISAVLLKENQYLDWAGEEGSGLLGLALFIGAFGTWAVPIIQDRSANITRDIGQAFIGFVLIWFFLHSIFLLHLNSIGAGACIFAIVNVAITDSFALIWGRLIGKHSFRPILSPKKTWEGVVGGVISAGIVGYLAQPLLPELDAMVTALLGVILAIVGTTGDLMLSSIKRDLGIKDWSQMLPGHGGLLDRIDSFILVAPATYWVLIFLGS
ncbi:MAG: phosphatidate cytidylyltransferase [Candidatus Thermoplasmatota archaeon]|nr:phosphatidate cytidylyltransferase [Candidatus Thermoplasmatota archaeon]